MQKIEIKHIKATRVVKKMGIKVNDNDALQSVNWNRIDQIYKRKVATEMPKIVMGADGDRIKDMFETKVGKGRGMQLQIRGLNSEIESVGKGNNVIFD